MMFIKFDIHLVITKNSICKKYKSYIFILIDILEMKMSKAVA